MRKMQKSPRSMLAVNPGHALFDELAAVAAGVQPEDFVEPADLTKRISELRKVFDADCLRVAAVADTLSGSDISEYGAETSAIFDKWEKERGGPTLPALVSHAMRIFDLDEDAREVKAAFMAALIGEVPNDLRYHGNEHYRKVLFHAIRLMATHNQLFEGDARELTAQQIAVLLTGACMHDVGHKGGDNLKEAVYTPGSMEQRAFDICRPYFEAVNMDRELMGQVETIVFCTDITFFAGENSPCVRMKKIYKHYYWQDDTEDVSMMMMGKLRRFEDNPQLVHMAMILHESDVGTSAGLSYERTKKETVDLMAERGVKTAGPKTVLAFLREQMSETMFTEAGKQIFGPVLKDVIAGAERDLADGKTAF